MRTRPEYGSTDRYFMVRTKSVAIARRGLEEEEEKKKKKKKVRSRALYAYDVVLDIYHGPRDIGHMACHVPRPRDNSLAGPRGLQRQHLTIRQYHSR